MAVRVATQTSDGILQIALASFVLFSPERQPDAASIAAVLAVTLLPFSFIGPFVSVVLDRWSRRQVILVVDSCRCCAGAVAGRPGGHRTADRTGRRALLRRRPAGDEPESVPARRPVGCTAAHHRPGRVHGGQLGGAHDRPGGRTDRSGRRDVAPAGAGRSAAGLSGERRGVRAGGRRVRGQRVAVVADPAAPARSGRTRPGLAPRHRRRAGRRDPASLGAPGGRPRTAHHRCPADRVRSSHRRHHPGLPELLPPGDRGRAGDRGSRAAGRVHRRRLRAGRGGHPADDRPDRRPGLDDRLPLRVRGLPARCRARSTPRYG